MAIHWDSPWDRILPMSSYTESFPCSSVHYYFLWHKDTSRGAYHLQKDVPSFSHGQSHVKLMEHPVRSPMETFHGNCHGPVTGHGKYHGKPVYLPLSTSIQAVETHTNLSIRGDTSHRKHSKGSCVGPRLPQWDSR